MQCGGRASNPVAEPALSELVRKRHARSGKTPVCTVMPGPVPTVAIQKEEPQAVIQSHRAIQVIRHYGNNNHAGRKRRQKAEGVNGMEPNTQVGVNRTITLKVANPLTERRKC